MYDEVEEMTDRLEDQLPEIISLIGKSYGIKEYIENPDFLEDRLRPWHQFGIFTHSKNVRRLLSQGSIEYFERWGIYSEVRNVLGEEIDGVNKGTLLECSGLLHDLGKIICYGDTRTNREHEKASIALLYQDLLNGRLKSLGLSKNHVDSIANYIKINDGLGKGLRDKIKHEGKLTLDHLSGEEIMGDCRNLAGNYPDVKTEVGIFFLADSLGKTDIRINAETDQEIEWQKEDVKRILEERGLPHQLEGAIMQLPVTIKLAEVYLKNLFNS